MKNYNKQIKTKIFIAILFFYIGFQINHCFFNKAGKITKDSSIENFKSNNMPEHPISELENAILLEGRKDFYQELKISYLDKELYEFLPWALLVANKFNSDAAYFDVYLCLFQLSNISRDEKDIKNWSLDALDDKTQKMAIEYLKKAAERDHEQAKEILGGYYLEGKYVEKNITLGNKLIEDAK